MVAWDWRIVNVLLLFTQGTIGQRPSSPTNVVLEIEFIDLVPYITGRWNAPLSTVNMTAIEHYLLVVAVNGTTSSNTTVPASTSSVNIFEAFPNISQRRYLTYSLRVASISSTGQSNFTDSISIVSNFLQSVSVTAGVGKIIAFCNIANSHPKALCAAVFLSNMGQNAYTFQPESDQVMLNYAPGEYTVTIQVHIETDDGPIVAEEYFLHSITVLSVTPSYLSSLVHSSTVLYSSVLVLSSSLSLSMPSSLSLSLSSSASSTLSLSMPSSLSSLSKSLPSSLSPLSTSLPSSLPSTLSLSLSSSLSPLSSSLPSSSTSMIIALETAMAMSTLYISPTSVIPSNGIDDESDEASSKGNSVVPVLIAVIVCTLMLCFTILLTVLVLIWWRRHRKRKITSMDKDFNKPSLHPAVNIKMDNNPFYDHLYTIKDVTKRIACNNICPATGATNAEADISPFYDHLKTTQDDYCSLAVENTELRTLSSHSSNHSSYIEMSNTITADDNARLQSNQSHTTVTS